MRKLHLLTIAGMVLLVQPSWAAIVYTVQLDTSALVGKGAFSLDYQFIDGSGSPTDLNNNTVTAGGFNFGAGSPSGTAILFGGATGDLTGGVTLQDTQFFNEFTQGFNPGNLLSFNLQVTTNPDPGGVPDELSFAILDSTGAEVATTGPASEFFSVTIDSANPTVLFYGSAPGAAFDIPAPSVTVASAVPEPGEMGLTLAWLLAMFWSRGRHRRR